MKSTQTKEILLYLIVGIMTTAVSWGACFLARLFLDASYELQNLFINTIGWLAGIFFAYPLNRKWVFKSSNPQIIHEFLVFVCSRITTWLLDVLVMWLLVNVYSLNNQIIAVLEYLNYDLSSIQIASVNYWISKIFISSSLVIVSNFILSKIFVFKTKY